MAAKKFGESNKINGGPIPPGMLWPFGDPDVIGITKENWDKLMPKFNKDLPVLGTVIIFGTGGEIDKGKGFKQIWDNSK